MSIDINESARRLTDLRESYLARLGKQVSLRTLMFVSAVGRDGINPPRMVDSDAVRAELVSYGHIFRELTVLYRSAGNVDFTIVPQVLSFHPEVLAMRGFGDESVLGYVMCALVGGTPYGYGPERVTQDDGTAVLYEMIGNNRIQNLLINGIYIRQMEGRNKILDALSEAAADSFDNLFSDEPLVHIGGSHYQAVLKAKGNVHVCRGGNTDYYSDYTRDEALLLTTNLSMFKNPNHLMMFQDFVTGPERYRCNSFEVCRHEAFGLFVDHTTEQLSPQDVLGAMVRRNAYVVVGYYLDFPELELHSEGVTHDGALRWRSNDMCVYFGESDKLTRNCLLGNILALRNASTYYNNIPGLTYTLITDDKAVKVYQIKRDPELKFCGGSTPSISYKGRNLRYGLDRKPLTHALLMSADETVEYA